MIMSGCAIGMHQSESGWGDSVEITDVTGALVASQISSQLQSVPASKINAGLQKKIKHYQYRVGPYDVLQITVWDHPELTTPAGQFRGASETGNAVRADGTIFYPFVGVMKVSGKSVEEIRLALTSRLAKYIRSPQVDVRVAAFRSQKVYISGEVAKPGILPITDKPLTILDAVNESGGIKPINVAGEEYEADLQNVILTRAGREYRIDLLGMYKNGNISRNYLLRDGDSLYVPDNNHNKVFVLGEVTKQQSLRMHNGRKTLAEALSDAGGLDLNYANASRIYVLRGVISGQKGSGTQVPWARDVSEPKKPAIYKLDAGSADALILADQFQLQPRDVVFVATHGIANWGRTLNHLSSTITAIGVGLAARK